MAIQNPIELQSKGNGGYKLKKSKERWKILILRPREYREIVKQCDRRHQIIFSCLLLTGMRYQELVRFRQHREWYDDKQFIHLPAGLGERKVKRTDPERWIRLSYMGRQAIESLFDVQLPSIQSLNQYVKYTFSIPHFSMKTFRKTYESWLVFYFDGKERQIAQSQGHDTWTQFEHYLNLPFTEEDKLEMKEFVEGWI